MRPRPGTGLLLFLLLAGLSWQWGRVLFPRGEHPAFFMEETRGVRVALGVGFPSPGVHQFSDGTAPEGVIELTIGEGVDLAPFSGDLRSPLEDGESLDLVEDGTGGRLLTRAWMPAGQRMVLGVPLHPGRMSAQDWEALPGIGPKLAEVIEKDRQENGEFATLEALQRVRGVGPKRIESWRPFFCVEK